jgi:hypothetical protein
MNFLEGTAYPAKHQRQQSPTAPAQTQDGAIALALNAMGDKFQAILDVTIVYPDGVPTFWAFLSGKTKRIVVRVQTLPVPEIWPTETARPGGS